MNVTSSDLCVPYVVCKPIRERVDIFSMIAPGLQYDKKTYTIVYQDHGRNMQPKGPFTLD